MNTNTTSPLQAAQLDVIARIAAWNVIANEGLPAGTKVTVKDRQATIHPRGGQPAHVPYGPTDTLDSLYDALKAAAQAVTQDSR